jgi:hypothetical protein
MLIATGFVYPTADEGSLMLSRLLPLSGIVFVVFALVAVVGFGGDTPDTDASGASVLSFYDEHSVRQAIGAFVFAASVPFLVAFAASLATTLWPRNSERPPVWELVLVGGGVLTAATVLVTAWLVFALADAGDQRLSGPALQALNALGGNTWIAFNSAFGVMMLGAAGSLLGSGIGLRWLGWAALVLGIALFIPYADFIALLLTLVWIIVASVMLFRRRLDTGHALAPDPI